MTVLVGVSCTATIMFNMGKEVGRYTALDEMKRKYDKKRQSEARQ